MRTLVWFRGKDLRVDDHAPLTDALLRGEVVPLFVLDPYFFAPERARRIPHRMQFLLESLAGLSETIGRLGSRLLLVRGKSHEVIPAIVRRFAIDRVVAQRWTEPFARGRDERVRQALSVPFELFEGETLVAPGTLRTQGSTPYSVFTPFARAFAAQVKLAEPLPAPLRLPPLPQLPVLEPLGVPTLMELGIARNPELIAGGEAAGQARLAQFLSGPASNYHLERDRLDLARTSRLSADLKFGTLSPRRVWHAARRALTRAPLALASFQNELVWREFTHSTLWDFPWVLELPFRAGFRTFPYRNDEGDLRAWSQGRTGYPIVDAAARQLLAEGFVHNRARMIAASFLTKHLLVDYRRGERHYLEWLVDGDWAQNNAGWQWSAGSGLDAQPYFRVFNPRLQGEKFDPEGDYVRRWVPELSGMPARYIHAPSAAPPEVLRRAHVTLGATYPLPIVPHEEARSRFLALAETLGSGSRQAAVHEHP
jgi:deoxyribodipyrimidine photo-lyase